MPAKGKPISLIRGKKISNLQELTQSIMDCRGAYSNYSDMTFSLWYEKHFGIKSARVLEILGAKAQGPGGAA